MSFDLSMLSSSRLIVWQSEPMSLPLLPQICPERLIGPFLIAQTSSFLSICPMKHCAIRSILWDVFSELRHKLQVQVPELSENADARTRAEWKDLLEATDGFSGRHLRKLVLEAMTRTERLSMQPDLVSLQDLICVAHDTRERMRRDREHGGTYEYTYDDPGARGEEAHEYHSH